MKMMQYDKMEDADMKKILTGILAVALVASVGTTVAFAADFGGCRRHFVDADGDGICDNYGTGCRDGNGCGNYADADGDGVCDNYGTNCGNGGNGCGNYVDGDGDGVCDNFGTKPTARPNSAVNGTGSAKSVVNQKKKAPAKGKTTTVNGVKYKVTKSATKNGTVSVSGIKNKKAKSATIPAAVKVSGYTFKVTSIASKAFSGCKKLSKINIKSASIKSVGKKAFYKVSKSARATVPSSKKTAYNKLFKKGGFSGSCRVNAVKSSTDPGDDDSDSRSDDASNGRGWNGRGNYVDADGDGICDNYGANGCGRNYVDADGDGVCDNYATRGGHGCSSGGHGCRGTGWGRRN